MTEAEDAVDTVPLDRDAPDAVGTVTPDAVTPDASTPDASTPDDVDAVTPEAVTPDAGTRRPTDAPSHRWRHALTALLAVVCVLAVAAVGLEHFVRGKVETVVRGALPGLSQDAEVSTEGVVLTQVLAGSLDSLSVSGSQLHLEQRVENAPVTALDLHDVTATLSGVEIAQPYNADTLDASGTITWQDLAVIVARLSPRLEQVSLAPGEPGTTTMPGTLTATAKVFGKDAVFLIVPSLTQDGDLLMTATEATVGGVTFDLTQEDSLVMRLLDRDTPEFVVNHDLLPSGLTFSAVVVTQEGLRVSMSGQDLDLAALGG